MKCELSANVFLSGMAQRGIQRPHFIMMFLVVLLMGGNLQSWAAADDETLNSHLPGQFYELAFPDIGPTLFTLATGEERECTLMYRLPDNYDPEKEFPVFVFLTGGNGGGMKSAGLGRAHIMRFGSGRLYWRSGSRRGRITSP